ncbi:MAG: hypothetical protein NT133_09770 [Alphaproteobacteria bacterium]|nr:hypothetical protein [Alphaproteobacteria bacterium]
MNDMQPARPVFDRTTQDIGNIVEFGHVNVRVPDQRLATIFYVMGLGLTRDPYLVVGVDNMWVNAANCQFHLPAGPAQVLRGTTGLVFPSLDALMARLDAVAPRLEGTSFSYARSGDTVEVTCPWGNRMRCHAPDEARFGRITLGMPYVEIDVAPGTAEGIARFYAEVFANPGTTGSDVLGRFARIPVGLGEALVFRETTRSLPAFDGHHIQIAIADFSGPHRRLQALGLISEESNAAQYRFERIIDPATGADLAVIEHEVRSMRHPMFARAMVNRNPEQTNNRYAPGREAWVASMPPEAL